MAVPVKQRHVIPTQMIVPALFVLRLNCKGRILFGMFELIMTKNFGMQMNYQLPYISLIVVVPT